MDDKAKRYLRQYLETLGNNKRKKYISFSSGYFCADEKNAEICSDLILKGIKTASCSMKYWYSEGEEIMPVVGHLHVVTDWQGNPTSIIETISVTECRFCEIDEEFAEWEGEGDRSLEWWHKSHWEFFSKECEELDIEPSENMLIVKEIFRVVYNLNS